MSVQAGVAWGTENIIFKQGALGSAFTHNVGYACIQNGKYSEGSFWSDRQKDVLPTVATFCRLALLSWRFFFFFNFLTAVVVTDCQTETRQQADTLSTT
jgi:hypothetical protein